MKSKKVQVLTGARNVRAFLGEVRLTLDKNVRRLA